VVDKTILAAKIAAVRDAVGRIRAVLTKDPAAFSSDRTAREVVILNLWRIVWHHRLDADP